MTPSEKCSSGESDSMCVTHSAGQLWTEWHETEPSGVRLSPHESLPGVWRLRTRTYSLSLLGPHLDVVCERGFVHVRTATRSSTKPTSDRSSYGSPRMYPTILY